MGYICIILFLSTTLVCVSGAKNKYYFGSYTKGVSESLVSRQVTFVKSATMKFNMDEAMDLTIHGVEIYFHNEDVGSCMLKSGGKGQKHVAIEIEPDFWQHREITVSIEVFGTYPEGKKPDLGARDITLPESAYVLSY